MMDLTKIRSIVEGNPVQSILSVTRDYRIFRRSMEWVMSKLQGKSMSGRSIPLITKAAIVKRSERSQVILTSVMSLSS